MSATDPYDVFQTSPLLIVISGPSGAGKDAVIQSMKERDVRFHFVVTTTSRPMRVNEQDGVDYFFITKEAFEEMIKKDELLEYALVYDEYKGIPKQQVQEAMQSGKDVIMRIDVQGASTIRKLWKDAILIFITVRSEDELIHRLITRKTESVEKLKKRIETARQEMQHLGEFDYVVENITGQLEESVSKIEAIITAEHLRVQPRKVTL
jgi:guanylate kinase